MPRQGLGHSSVDIYNMVTPGTDDPVWRNKTSGQLMVGYQQTRNNFVLHSQDATDAEAWTKANTAIDSTLYEAPDNSTTANAIKSDGTGEQVYKITQTSLSVTAGKTYTLSVHVKKENLGFARIYFSDGAAKNADFNLTTGAVGSTSNTIGTQVDSMDDGWFRCSMTFVATSTVSSGQVRFSALAADGDNTPSVAVSGIILIYVWGFQLEENSEMSAYIVTTNAARTTTETLNDTSETWDFDSADLMPEADPDDDGVWEVPDNVVLNGDYEELGSNLVTNGTFDVDANWTTATGWDINTTTKKAECDGSQSGNAELKQQDGVAGVTLNIVNGKTYELTFDLVVQAGAITQVEVGNTYDTNDITSSGTYTRTLKASSTNKRLTIAGNSTFEGSVDNVTLKQVDPNDRWSLGTGWSIEDGKLKSVNGGNYTAYQASILTSGTTYEIKYTISDYSSGTFGIRAHTAAGITATANGTYTDQITSNGTHLYFIGFTTFNGSVDNVTVREYAIQPQDV